VVRAPMLTSRPLVNSQTRPLSSTYFLEATMLAKPFAIPYKSADTNVATEQLVMITPPRRRGRRCYSRRRTESWTTIRWYMLAYIRDAFPSSASSQLATL